MHNPDMELPVRSVIVNDERHVVTVSDLREQDANESKRIKEFPPVLPQMQTGKSDRPKTVSNNNHKRARRKDAEPIIQKFIKLRITGSFYFALPPPEQAIWLS